MGVYFIIFSSLSLSLSLSCGRCIYCTELQKIVRGGEHVVAIKQKKTHRHTPEWEQRSSARTERRRRNGICGMEISLTENRTGKRFQPWPSRGLIMVLHHEGTVGGRSGKFPGLVPNLKTTIA